MTFKKMRLYVIVCVVMFAADCHGQLFTKGSDFAMDDPIVSTSFFHWFTPTSGQLIGPWRPLEGRENWDGSVEWWKGQIKQTMRANIDVLYVHLIREYEDQRINLFKAFAELRAEGYDIPRIAPFLDMMITWLDQEVDMSTAEPKQELIGEYVRFYEQYFSVNTDEHAADYIAKIDGRPVLVTWHMHVNTTNLDEFTREDLEQGLAEPLSDRCPEFNNGIYMVTTAASESFSFADEKTFLFELHCYHVQKEHKGLVSAMVKPGYCDQNVRTPGYCLPRAGGAHYRSAWEQVVTSPVVERVYVESFNEYDEGSGIYVGDPGPYYNHSGAENESADTWSAENDPFEYINTTAEGARRFNDTPDLDAVILSHDAPAVMEAGKEYRFTVVARNEGDRLWTPDADIHLGLQSTGDMAPTGWPVEMTKDQLRYGGIFRGCPVAFEVTVVVPGKAGLHQFTTGMLCDGKLFGEEFTIQVKVQQLANVSALNRRERQL